MNKINQLFIIILLLFVFTTTQAQKYSNEFLQIGVGAKPLAMGGAVTAHTNDVTSVFWNPAGLSGVNKDLQVSFMHTEQFAGIGKFDYLGVAKKLKDSIGILSFSMIRFAIDDIPNTLSLYENDGTINYDNVTPFSAADYAFVLSFARTNKKGNLNYGGNAKVIHRKIGPFAQALGFGIDAGIQYRIKNWTFGASAKDITTTFNAWWFDFTDEQKDVLELTNNEIPLNAVEKTLPRLVLGTSYLKQFKKISLLASLDLEMTTDGQRNTLVSAKPVSIDPKFGLEIGYDQIVFLRGGVNNIQRKTDDFTPNKEYTIIQPNVGIGLNIKGIKLDYAYTNVAGANTDYYSHAVSVIADIDFKQFKQAFKRTE